MSPKKQKRLSKSLAHSHGPWTTCMVGRVAQSGLRCSTFQQNFLIYPRQSTKITTNEYNTVSQAMGNDTVRWAYRNESDKMARWMQKRSVVDAEWEEISAESTARGIPSLLRLHDWGSDPSVLIMMALNTAETVWMYVVRFLARSHVRPISSQSLLCILRDLASILLEFPVLSSLSCKRNLRLSGKMRGR